MDEILTVLLKRGWTIEKELPIKGNKERARGSVILSFFSNSYKAMIGSSRIFFYTLENEIYIIKSFHINHKEDIFKKAEEIETL